jgi:hypothetical protein
MATRTLAAGGGNWATTGTWVEGFAPVAGDVVTCSGVSAALTVAASAACASIDFTGYTGTFQIGAAKSLTCTGPVKFASGMTLSSGGTGAALILNGALTLTCAGQTLPFGLTLQGANTYTLADDCHVQLPLSIGNGSSNIVLNGNSLFAETATLSFATSGTISGTTVLKVVGPSGGTCTMNPASAATIQINVTFIGGSNSIDMGTGNTYKANTGTWLYTSGTFTANTSTLSVSGSMTLTLGSSAHLNNMTISAAATVTLGADLYVDGTMTLPNADAGFSGAFDVYAVTLANTTIATSTRTWTFVSGQTLYVGKADGSSGGMTIAGLSATVRAKFQSSSTPTQFKLVLRNGGTQSIGLADFTDCNAALGQPLYSYTGSISNCAQVFGTFPTVRRQPRAGLGI